jgi:hypothetical protein
MPKYRVEMIMNAKNASEAKQIVRRSNPNGYPDWSQRDEQIALARDAVSKLLRDGLIKDDASIRVVELIIRRASLSESEIFDVVGEAAQRSGGAATSQSIADVFQERRAGDNIEVARRLSQYRIDHIADDFVPGGKYAGNPNPNGSSTFEITSFLIHKRGARLTRMGLTGDWDNPSVYQLPDGRNVYLVGNDWQFEGSQGNGYRSLKERLDSEVASREMQAYREQQAIKEREHQKRNRSTELFMQGAKEIHAGMMRAGVDPRFDVREDSAGILVKFDSNSWVEYDKRTQGFSATAVGKTVSGWKGMRERLAKYGEYE